MTTHQDPIHPSITDTDPREFLKDSMGRLRTQSLFQEFKDPGYPAYFTLRERDYTDQDGNLYVSLRRIYLESEDPTEYRFAQRAFGSWRHWTRIRNLQWFRPHLKEWREELDARLRSAGVQALSALARGEKPEINAAAARYLADGNYLPKAGKRGRPSREEVQGERKRIAASDQELEDDFERIMQP